MKGMKTTNPARWFLALAVLGMAITSQAALFVWDGGGANNKLNTVNNWVSNTWTGNTTTTAEFSDGSLRTEVDINTGTQYNVDISNLVFAGDGFSFINTGTKALDLRTNAGNPTGIVMNCGSTIVFTATVLARSGTGGQNIGGTGTGTLVFAKGNLVDNNGTFGGASTIVLNAPAGTTLSATRTFNLSDTVRVLANNTSGGAFGKSSLSVNNGATLGGSGILTPGDAGTAKNMTAKTGARLSPGDNYHTGDDVGTLTCAFGHANGLLDLQTGALFTFDLAAPGASDMIAVTAGGVKLNGQQFGDFTFNVLPGFTSGTYTLIDSVATVGSLGAVTTGTVGDKPAVLKLVGNDLVLEVKATGTLIWVR